MAWPRLPSPPHSSSLGAPRLPSWAPDGSAGAVGLWLMRHFGPGVCNFISPFPVRSDGSEEGEEGEGHWGPPARAQIALPPKKKMAPQGNDG